MSAFIMVSYKYGFTEVEPTGCICRGCGDAIYLKQFCVWLDMIVDGRPERDEEPLMMLCASCANAVREKPA